MPPNLDDNLVKRATSDLIRFMTPLAQNGTLSEDDSDDETGPQIVDDDLIWDPTRVLIPLDQNLRALLVQVTGTEDLERVTQVKLRVIAREVPLQHLSVYTPSLRELILDGSVVSTLRDLGCGLKNLKILRVNRCNITFLDNMFALESLEELHVADNFIENCVPIAFLPEIKVLDLRRNRLKNVPRTLTFLTICEKLEHIYLEGNDEIWQFPKYRQTVKSLLPTLRSLDGITYTEDECNVKVCEDDKEFRQYLAVKSKESQQLTKSNLSNTINGNNSPRPRPISTDRSNGFIVLFPPKVFLDKTKTSNK